MLKLYLVLSKRYLVEMTRHKHIQILQLQKDFLAIQDRRIELFITLWNHSYGGTDEIINEPQKLQISSLPPLKDMPRDRPSGLTKLRD